MTNYEKIKKMNKSQLRKFLAEFCVDNIVFCSSAHCKLWENCPIVTSDKPCPISNNKIVRWWLDQEVEK